MDDEDELSEDDPGYVRDLVGTCILFAIGILTLIGALLYYFLH